MSLMLNTGDTFSNLAAGVLDDSTFETDSGIDNGQEYPDASMEYAFRLWCFDASRNPRRVVELLKQRRGITVPVSTVLRWSVENSWVENSVILHQTFKQAASDTIQAGIDFGAVHAVTTLREILSEPDASATARVKAATVLLALAGYVAQPPGASAISVNVHAGRGDWSDMSDEDLAEIAEEYGRSNAVSPPIDITPEESYLSHQRGGIDQHGRSTHNPY